MKVWNVCLLVVTAVFLVACEPDMVVEQTLVPETAVSPEQPPVVETVEIVRELPVTVEVTREVVVEYVVEVTPMPLGSPSRPVQLLFPPMQETAVIKNRSAALVNALQEATGLSFEVGIVDSQQRLIELMCAAPQDTIGFMSAAAFVVAHEQCNAQTAVVSVGTDGLSWQTGMIVTRRNTGLTQLADLDGKIWGIPDTTSVPNYHYIKAMFAEAGIEPAEEIIYPGDNSALLALHNGEVDFVTATYIPPIMPNGEEWVYGEDAPDVWRRLGIPPTRSPIGYVLVLAEPEFGGYRLRDARSGIFDTTPEIYNETFVVVLSAQIPRDTVALGADFPTALGRQITAVLTEFGQSDTCQASLCASDFYGWAGVEPVTDSQYDPLRQMMTLLDWSAEDVWQNTGEGSR